MRASKAIRLISLFPTRPTEFLDRIRTIVEVHTERKRLTTSSSGTANLTDALAHALRVSSEDIAKTLAETELRQIENRVAESISKSKHIGPFDSNHNGDFSLAKAIYVICRFLSPLVVLETGVAYGVTSAFTLQALAVNRKGRLYSVDLPPLGKNADGNVGAFIPTELKDRWQLHRGSSKRALPKLLSAIGHVDLFVHDSLHTYGNMDFEFMTVWPCLSSLAALVADDVGLNNAFQAFTARVRPAFSAVVKEECKDAQFGILVRRM